MFLISQFEKAPFYQNKIESLRREMAVLSDRVSVFVYNFFDFFLFFCLFKG